MALLQRPDGSPVRDVPPTRRIMPFLMRTRNESVVYFEQEVDLTRTLLFLDEFNADRDGKKATLFHLFLWAAVQALAARPRLNRFVMGGRLYQRDGIWISYSAKKALADHAPIVVIKRRFDPATSFGDLVEQVQADVSEGKSDRESHVDRELKLFLAMPGWLLALGVRLLRWADEFSLLPASFIRPDPLYASLFVANLGSVRLDSAYHHLYEYGTIPLFAVIGRKKSVLAADGERTVCSIKYSLDERVEDGLYCAAALDLVKRVLEDPAEATRAPGSPATA
ncbi:MAG: hypothetical protein FJZ01_10185 [Candidatus Sericytochromatia bacterium]|nr:hypothetical protein [Candidatus Tanganyikabacteria bacterium]